MDFENTETKTIVKKYAKLKEAAEDFICACLREEQGVYSGWEAKRWIACREELDKGQCSEHLEAICENEGIRSGEIKLEQLRTGDPMKLILSTNRATQARDFLTHPEILRNPYTKNWTGSIAPLDYRNNEYAKFEKKKIEAAKKANRDLPVKSNKKQGPVETAIQRYSEYSGIPRNKVRKYIKMADTVGTTLSVAFMRINTTQSANKVWHWLKEFVPPSAVSVLTIEQQENAPPIGGTGKDWDEWRENNRRKGNDDWETRRYRSEIWAKADEEMRKAHWPFKMTPEERSYWQRLSGLESDED